MNAHPDSMQSEIPYKLTWLTQNLILEKMVVSNGTYYVIKDHVWVKTKVIAGEIRKQLDNDV